MNTEALARALREQAKHGSPDYPLKVYLEKIPQSETVFVRQHWHPEIEIVCVLKGAIESCMGEQRVVLHVGDSLLINSGTLHGERGLYAPEAEVYFILFSAMTIARGNDLIYSQYVRPVLQNAAVPFWAFTEPEDSQMEIRNHIAAILEYDRLRQDGYELATVNELGALWYSLIRARCYRTEKNSEQDLRIKQMITFIHENYMDPITLHDVAQVASVSKRECQRCFSHTLGISPVQYLLGRRLEMAASLLRGGEQSVSEIAFSCGFNSSSYFGKRFHEAYGKTPLRYREQAKERLKPP